MKEGYEKDDFFDTLKELEECTRRETLSFLGKKLHATFRVGKKGINWTLSESLKPESFGSSRGYYVRDFMDEVGKLDKGTSSDCMDILTLKESHPLPNGKVKCIFYQIDPYLPFSEEDDGKLSIPILDMTLRSYEYEALLETKIAFYDFFTLYPVKKVALASLGSIADTRGLFKVSDKVPLAQSIVLAERLADVEKVSVTTRTLSERVKSVVYAKSSERKDMEITQTEFFKKCFDEAAGHGMYTFGKWKVSDSLSQIDIYPVLCACFKPVIRISISDSTGTGWSVKAYAEIGTGLVKLKSNIIKKHLAPNMELLFNGIYEAFTEFDGQLLKNSEYRVKPLHLKKVKDTLGKRRAENNGLFKTGISMNGSLYAVAEEIVKNTYNAKLSPQMAERLSEAYFSTIKEIGSRV